MTDIKYHIIKRRNEPTYKLSELIDKLKEYKRIYGDIPVVMAREVEGERFATINQTNLGSSFDVEHGFMIIYPYDELLELDEINGYKGETK